MIDPITAKILRVWMRIACLFKVVPYDYDQKANQLIRTNRLGFCVWYFINMIQIVSPPFLIYGLTIAIQNEDEIWGILLHILILLASFIGPISQIQIAEHQTLLPYFWKCFFIFTENAQERYVTPGYPTPDFPTLDKRVDLFVKLVAISSIVLPCNMIGIYAYIPKGSAFLSSYFLDVDFPIDTPTEWILILLSGIYTFWYSCLVMSYLVFLCLIASFVSVADFLSKETRPNQKSKVTRDIIREPGTALYIYRCVQIFIIIGNELLREIAIAMVNIVLFLGIVSFCASVRFRKILPLPSMIFFGSINVFCIMIVSLTHLGLGKVFDGSKSWVSAWSRYGQHLEKRDRKLMMKYVRSCRLNKFEIGSFGYFHKKAIGKQVLMRFSYYANKILLALRKY